MNASIVDSACSPAVHRLVFSQSLDRTRPAVLMTQFDAGGKPLEPKRCGQLHYQYEDTGESVCVPNAWYNQPLAARESYWRFVHDQATERLRAIEKRLAAARAEKSSYFEGQKTTDAILGLESSQRTAQKILDEVAGVLALVRAGELH